MVPRSAYDSPRAIQCVVNMEKRRCLLRRKDSETIEALTGYNLCGIYCVQRFRGMGVATDMLIRLLCDIFRGFGRSQNLPSGMVNDPLYDSLPDT